MKTLPLRLATVLMAGGSFFLTSCARPYGAGALGSGSASRQTTPPLLNSAGTRASHHAQTNIWLFANTRLDPCSPGCRSSSHITPIYHTRHARPYYANYGWGRPYYGSTWYAPSYTSRWWQHGDTRPEACSGPMSHYGGWSYVYR